MSIKEELEKQIENKNRICSECPIYEDCCSIAYDGYDCEKLLQRKLEESEENES